MSLRSGRAPPLEGWLTGAWNRRAVHVESIHRIIIIITTTITWAVYFKSYDSRGRRVILRVYLLPTYPFSIPIFEKTNLKFSDHFCKLHDVRQYLGFPAIPAKFSENSALPRSIYLQSSASIRPRTDLPEFGLCTLATPETAMGTTSR